MGLKPSNKIDSGSIGSTNTGWRKVPNPGRWPPWGVKLPSRHFHTKRQEKKKRMKRGRQKRRVRKGHWERDTKDGFRERERGEKQRTEMRRIMKGKVQRRQKESGVSRLRASSADLACATEERMELSQSRGGLASPLGMHSKLLCG